jgi:hypothetical protein
MIRVRRGQYRSIRIRLWCSVLSSVAALTMAGAWWARSLPFANWLIGLAMVTLAETAFTLWQTRAANLDIDPPPSAVHEIST